MSSLSNFTLNRLALPEAPTDIAEAHAFYDDVFEPINESSARLDYSLTPRLFELLRNSTHSLLRYNVEPECAIALKYQKTYHNRHIKSDRLLCPDYSFTVTDDPMTDRQKLLIFSKTPVPEIVASRKWPHFENKTYDQCVLESDAGLPAILAREKPHVIISTGKEADWPELFNADYDTRIKWFHCYNITDANVEDLGEKAGNRYIFDALATDRQIKKVSAFTCTYKTDEARLKRLYTSLQNQTWANWEWVIYDDSDDDGVTFEILRQMVRSDHRITVYRGTDRTGVIGHNKRLAAMACNGEILAEIDHDDMITEDCFALLVQAYHKHPECGFYYTDACELYEDGECIVYGKKGDKIAFEFTTYRKETWRDKEFDVLHAAPINAKTIRHICSTPNHIRAWRRDIYHRIGGHNPKFYVADDFEIMVRTFLATRFLHIPKLCYFQFYRRGNEANTQRIRRFEIQRLVRLVSFAYDQRIHDRILKLGHKDWVWTEQGGSALSTPNPKDLSSVASFHETLELPY